MTQDELDGYRQQLMTLARRLTGDVADLAAEAFHGAGGEASGSLSNTPMHMADLATDNYEQEMTLTLMENGGQTLEEINAALARLDAGTFGVCEECKGGIGRERLNALPHTRFCVTCARRKQESADDEGSRPARL